MSDEKLYVVVWESYEEQENLWVDSDKESVLKFLDEYFAKHPDESIYVEVWIRGERLSQNHVTNKEHTEWSRYL